MKFYIRPEQLEEVKKKLSKITKNLSIAPEIKFSEPMTKRKTDHIIYDKGWGGSEKKRYFIDVIEVDVDLQSNVQWKLVATVYFKEGIVAMLDSSLFGLIPSHLGLEYKKCDSCGHSRFTRAVSHIFFNTKTGEWKQLGSECAKEVFGTALDKFVVNLYEVFNVEFGDDMDFMGWCSKQPDHSFLIGHSIESIVPAVVGYRKEVNPNWEKASGHMGTYTWLVDEEGTTKKLARYYSEHPDLLPDKEYVDKVHAFVQTLADDTRTDYDPCTGTPYIEEGFNSKIKRVFGEGYVREADFFTVFFAVKMYEESLTLDDWKNSIKGLQTGQIAEFRGLSLVRKDLTDGYYGLEYWATFESGNGVTFKKSISNWDGFDKKFKGEDGKYYFTARVDYINDHNRTVRLGGRVSKLS